MARLSCLLVLVAFCVGAVTVRGDDPWFPDPFASWESPPPPMDGTPPPPLYPAPEGPSPYYNAPPYMGGEPPVDSPPYDSSPPTDGPSPPPWMSSWLWARKTDSWPVPYTADTPIEDAFGGDSVKVYGQISMLDGIMSEGDDGYSDLLKQGITALLNCADKHFKYSKDDIKKSFSFKTSLSSEAAATVQAKEFQDANESYRSP
ncbi:unnamed protein product [Calypogeia fissa]